MRKKGNLLKSNRSRTGSTSMNDLVTQSEQNLSSQASVRTNTSKNYSRSNSQMAQSSALSQNFDDYQDIIGEDIDTLFITPEEEKKIQNILEFARKGKINPGNAFEIPVRVIDPQLTESSNMRFWKFASELLYASMSIYDKRVENMFQTTNRMFENLIRVQGEPNRPLTEEQVQEKHRKQRGELIQMDVGDIGKVQTLSSYDIGPINCEEPQKINIKNQHNQFLTDPLFHKRLQAFDSNTLVSLFMNVFECGDNLQVTFFTNDNEYRKDLKVEEQSKMEEKIEDQMQQFQERVPNFVYQGIQKLNSGTILSPVYNQIRAFKQQNIRQAIENRRNSVKDFTEEELSIFNKHQAQRSMNDFLNNDNDGTETISVQSLQGENQFNFQFNVSDNTQFSQSHNRAQSRSMPNTVAYSARSQHISQFYDDESDMNFTLMTPWELQFKGMKLQKKMINNKSQRKRQPRGPKISTEEIEIDFMDRKKQLRSSIFVRSGNTRFTNKDDQTDINLLPLSMNPFTQALKRRRLQKKPDLSELNRQMIPFVPQGMDLQRRQTNEDRQQQSFPQDNVINLDVNYQEENISQRTTNFESNLAHQQVESQGLVYRSTGIRNIREIKQKIYKRIAEGQSVRLSELNINISPSSILIVFLHLVNENNINITSLEDEHDLEISPRIQ